MTEHILPSGNKLLMGDKNGIMMLFIYEGPSFKVKILGPNPFGPGTPEWMEEEEKIATTIKKYS